MNYKRLPRYLRLGQLHKEQADLRLRRYGGKNVGLGAQQE